MKFRNSKVYIFTVLIMFLLFFGSVVPIKKAIVLKKIDSKTVLAYLPVKKDQTFQILYTHSIHLTDVIESYKILKNNNIEQIELMYDDTSIGMPADAENGEKFVHENGHYYIKNMKRIFPSFNLSTGQVVANHRIIYENKMYPIKKYIEPGTFITIQVEKLSLLHLLKGVNIIGKTAK